MQQMEQEIKDLQAGLAAVVQALHFLQTFLESDYGLKYQFHAYCTSPLYSHSSSLLETLKQKYPGTDLQDSCYTENDRLYQAHHGSPPGTDNTSLIHLRYSNQEAIHDLEQTVMNTVTSACATTCTTALNQNYDSNEDHPGRSMSSHHHNSPALPNVHENLNDGGRSPIIVNEDELFGMSDLATMKEESQEIYQQNEAEIDSFSRNPLEDENDSSDEIINIQSPNISEVLSNEPSKTNVAKRRGGRTKKEKVNEGYKCPHCRRKCPDKVKLEQHMTHHKQQFQCSECGIWLADKSVLNRHMRTHTGDRPFKCVFCKESFSRQDIVKKHILRKHKGMDPNTQSITFSKLNSRQSSNEFNNTVSS